MMNSTTAKTIYDMAKQFSGSGSVNRTICVRCLKAVRTKSLNRLCESITHETINDAFDKVTYTMEPEQVETRLKQIGLYQLVESSITNITPHFREMLDKVILGSFGYAEVENVIRARALEAVESGTMEPLMKALNEEWRNGCCAMSAEAVIVKLHEKGIWQLVANEISKQKK